MSITEDLAERLMEELNCETVFTIPVFGGIPIAESVVVSWIIMAVLTILSICLVRNLKVENPGKKQLALEVAIGGIYKFFDDLVGEEGRRYIPYLISIAIYIGVANLIGLIGFKPPTKDLNATAALALMSIVLIEYAGFHKKGLKGWVKSFAEPQRKAFLLCLHLPSCFRYVPCRVCRLMYLRQHLRDRRFTLT